MTASWQNQCGYVKICSTHDAKILKNSPGLWVFLNDHYDEENHRDRHPQKNLRASATLYLGITAGTKMGHWNLATKNPPDFGDFGAENFPPKKGGGTKKSTRTK